MLNVNLADVLSSALPLNSAVMLLAVSSSYLRYEPVAFTVASNLVTSVAGVPLYMRKYLLFAGFVLSSMIGANLKPASRLSFTKNLPISPCTSLISSAFTLILYTMDFDSLS